MYGIAEVKQMVPWNCTDAYVCVWYIMLLLTSDESSDAINARINQDGARLTLPFPCI